MQTIGKTKKASSRSCSAEIDPELGACSHSDPDTPSSTMTPIKTDVLIVGAGPAGLFQVFELGLLGLSAHVIDPLPHAGGQCITLYADKAIYDIPGLPSCTGRELTDRLMLQIKPFEPVFHFQDVVKSLEPLEGARGFKVSSERGLCFEAKSVVLANGVGAFLPRALNAPEQVQYLGKQLFHGQLENALSQFEASKPQKETQRWKVWIVGGEDEAVLNALTGLQAFKHLDITLIHRRTPLEIDPQLQEAWEEALEKSQGVQPKGTGDASEVGSTLAFKHGQIVHLLSEASEAGQNRTDQTALKALEWVDEKGQTHTSEVDLVVVNLGLSPQLGALSEWGAQMQKKQVTVNTEDFSTSLPGVFAVGDVITYPGKKKLILSGFHEAALASFGVAKWVLEKDRIPFEYTSASALLQARLRIEP